MKELAERAEVSRGAATRAVAGEGVQPVTLQRLEAALDRLEAEIHGERIDVEDPERAVTIRLPDGTEVTFKGGTPQEAAQFAQAFLGKVRALSARQGRTDRGSR